MRVCAVITKHIRRGGGFYGGGLRPSVCVIDFPDGECSMWNNFENATKKEVSKMNKKVKDKVNAAKEKVAAKKGKAKRKVGKAVKAVGAFALICSMLVGCATSEPASRATTARYGDIRVTIEACSNCTARITLGDGAIASADSTGSTESITANPTTDVKPQTDISVPVAKTAASEVASAAADGVKAVVGSVCADGSCTP